MKKSYQVFYIIKSGRKEELNHMFVMANNQKEATAKCKAVVKENTGKTAFRPTTKEPYAVHTVSGKIIYTI